MNSGDHFVFDLDSAIAASKNNSIREWILGYLRSDQRNKGVVEDIEKRNIVTVLLIEYPLKLLERITGAQAGEEKPESLPKWLERVKIVEDEIKNKNLPPPIVASDFWGKLYIVDGNHRHEALLKRGFKTYWTIFLLENPGSEEKVLKESKLPLVEIKAIVVDVGGVLVRELDRSKRTIWGAKLHLTPRQLTKEVYRTGMASLATVGKIKPERIWLDIKDKFHLKGRELNEMEHDFHAGDKLNDEFYTFMEDLHKHYKTALLSNAWLNARAIYSNKYHLDKVVDEMIISAEEGLRKPNKKIFQVALDRLGMRAEKVVYVDDRADNIRTANALGMHTVLFTDTNEGIEKVKSFL